GDDDGLPVLVHVGDRRIGRPQVDAIDALRTFGHGWSSRCSSRDEGNHGARRSDRGERTPNDRIGPLGPLYLFAGDGVLIMKPRKGGRVEDSLGRAMPVLAEPRASAGGG